MEWKRLYGVRIIHQFHDVLKDLDAREGVYSQTFHETPRQKLDVGYEYQLR